MNIRYLEFFFFRLIEKIDEEKKRAERTEQININRQIYNVKIEFLGSKYKEGRSFKHSNRIGKLLCIAPKEIVINTIRFFFPMKQNN